jgi:succinylglutamate desuccinylase
MPKINKIFKKLREPFETDEKSNIIDYNWHVDGILKNSQSYNKEPEMIILGGVTPKAPAKSSMAMYSKR